MDADIVFTARAAAKIKASGTRYWSCFPPPPGAEAPPSPAKRERGDIRGFAPAKIGDSPEGLSLIFGARLSWDDLTCTVLPPRIPPLLIFVDKGMPSMKTFSAKPHEVAREWFVVDATDKVLGRLASEIARRLRGKHKAIYTPHVDTGDFIVVTNVEKLRVTGNKAEDKKYFRHTGFPGGIYETSFAKMQQRFPARILEKAVKGMLPKGPLGYAMLKKLKCYAGAQHPHAAQQPRTLEIQG
jgi:large subunit ribosomal protein L13